jgi:hypothetical protein
MASRDITYCIKECEDMSCKHNKKHIKEIVLEDGSHPAAGALNWWVYPECEKGEFKAYFPNATGQVLIKKVTAEQVKQNMNRLKMDRM